VLSYDRGHDELYAANGDTVVVYKEGLETFRFTVDAQIGGIYGIAALDDGELLVLSSSGELFRCNFRGKLVRRVMLSGLPDSVGSFRPDRIQFAGGRVYLADSRRLKSVAIGPDGRFVSFHDLGAASAEGKKRLDDRQMGGFSVDDGGNILFTVPTLFRAYVVSPGGEVKSFGQPGSREGRFNIAGAIARDESGTYYVADALRCVVILYGPDFKYLKEVGGRGYYGGGLIAPSSMVVGNNWLFVSQGGERGVNAYRVY
jgi:hypothetical protein